MSDENGIVPFYVHGLTMSASLSRENVEVLSPEQRDTPALEIDVPAVTLDQFCKEWNITPDVVKIDVGGAELPVLRGAKNLLLNEGFTTLCEIHPRGMRFCGYSLPEFTAYLEDISYCSKPLDEPNAMENYHSLITPEK